MHRNRNTRIKLKKKRKRKLSHVEWNNGTRITRCAELPLQFPIVALKDRRLRRGIRIGLEEEEEEEEVEKLNEHHLLTILFSLSFSLSLLRKSNIALYFNGGTHRSSSYKMHASPFQVGKTYFPNNARNASRQIIYRIM